MAIFTQPYKIFVDKEEKSEPKVGRRGVYSWGAIKIGYNMNKIYHTSDFYFSACKIEDEEDPPCLYLFISKDHWDAGEGLDCTPEPQYLYDKLSSMFDDADPIMENTWEIEGDPKVIRTRLLQAGFTENSDLANYYKDM